jgi:hypothetical protein
MVSPAPENGFTEAVKPSPPLKIWNIFKGGWWCHPPPKNTYKNLGSGFFLLPTAPLVAQGRCCPKIQKKRGGEVLNLISFELGALGGKLMLIPYLF